MTDFCTEIEPLLPGYALGALDQDERRLVTEHLPSCPSCQATLQDYLEVRDGLLFSPPPVRPSANLRRALAAAVGSPRVESGFLRRWRIPAWAGALAITLLITLNLAVLGRASQVIRDQQLALEQLTAEQSKLAEALKTDQTAVALVSYPTSEIIRVQGDQAYGTFVYDPELEVAVLYAWGLEPLPEGETYQAWLIDPAGGRTNAGIFQASDDGRFTVMIVHSNTPLGAFRGLGVTIEPSGGSPSPTGPRVLAADF